MQSNSITRFLSIPLVAFSRLYLACSPFFRNQKREKKRNKMMMIQSSNKEGGERAGEPSEERGSLSSLEDDAA